VIDEYQNRRARHLLLKLLLKAAQSLQVRTLRGFLLADNLVMLRLLHKFEATGAGLGQHAHRGPARSAARS